MRATNTSSTCCTYRDMFVCLLLAAFAAVFSYFPATRVVVAWAYLHCRWRWWVLTPVAGSRAMWFHSTDVGRWRYGLR